MRTTVRKCLKSYKREDTYHKALVGINRGLTDLLDDQRLEDGIREIIKMNEDFVELRDVLNGSKSVEEAKQGFSKLKKRFQRTAGRKEKSRNYSRLVRQMKSWELGLFHCYEDERIPRTNNDMELLVKKLRRSWKRTTGLVNVDEYLLYHAPYAIYLLNFQLGYLTELGIKVNAYNAVKEVPKDKYRSALEKVKKRKAMDIFRKRANKDIDAALEGIVELNNGLGGSQE